KELAGYLAALPPLDVDGTASNEIIIDLTPEAASMWIDWYNNLDEVEETTRLDNIGMRLMALLAFTSGQQIVAAELMRRILDILEHQSLVREAYKPTQGMTLAAKIEDKIITQLHKRGPLTLNDLRRYTHAERLGGEKMLRTAINDLQAA